jgi:hypothetical protein
MHERQMNKGFAGQALPLKRKRRGPFEPRRRTGNYRNFLV